MSHNIIFFPKNFFGISVLLSGERFDNIEIQQILKYKENKFSKKIVWNNETFFYQVRKVFSKILEIIFFFCRIFKTNDLGIFDDFAIVSEI